MEKERMKKIFQNLNMNLDSRSQKPSNIELKCNFRLALKTKEWRNGPKRKVCRKLDFSTAPPSPHSTTGPYLSLPTIREEILQETSKKSRMEVDSLPAIDYQDDIMHTRSAHEMVLLKNKNEYCLQNSRGIYFKDTVLESNDQQKSLRPPSAKVVILSNILLPQTTYDVKPLEASIKKAKIPEQEHFSQLFSSISLAVTPPLDDTIENDSSHALAKDNDNKPNNQYLQTSTTATTHTITSGTTLKINKNSLICKIDLSRIKNKFIKSQEQKSIESSVSPSTSIKPVKKTPEKVLRSNRKTYHFSPINAGESDPDFSDSDPTYDANMEGILKRRPPKLLQSRRSRSLSSSSSGSSKSSEHSRSTSPMRKTRKRKRNPASWKYNTAKNLRNTGKSYVSVKTNKIVDARSVKPPCGEKCRFKCFDKFNKQERKIYFDKFWSLESLDLQRAFIKNCMVEIIPKYKYSKTENPRKSNHAFHLKQGDKKERVCKTFFMNTFDITDRRLRTVKEKCDDQNFLSDDKRGKHGNHKKMDPLLVSDIKSFIDSIPRVESHYTRATSTCEYIHPGRTLTEIYQDFEELQQQNGRPSGKFCNFYQIFKDTGLKMHQPIKDLCDICRDYKLAPNDDLKVQYDRHIIEKDLSRTEKKKDRSAIDDNNICAVYDLEAILQAPNGKSSSFYYKTKMNCYNFTIAELGKKDHTKEESNKAYTDVYSYFWDETHGQKGSIEIGTCVLDFLKMVNERSTSKSVNVTFYSDNCCGQNKNKYITTLYMFALQKLKNINSIRHKYLVKGHTQNENDNAHSLIEKEIQKFLKADTIYTPAQYIPLIKNAKKTGKKFEVHALTFDDFVDIKSLQSQWGSNFTKDTGRKILTWNEIKMLEFRKEEPFKFYYKTSYQDEEFREVEVRTRKALPNPDEIVLRKAYTERFPLSENKKNDLKSLIAKNVITSYYSSYYKDLI